MTSGRSLFAVRADQGEAETAHIQVSVSLRAWRGKYANQRDAGTKGTVLRWQDSASDVGHISPRTADLKADIVSTGVLSRSRHQQPSPQVGLSNC